METVLIVIHLIVVVVMAGVILLQRSEGGALGIGGGSNFMASRGQGNLLTKTTAILAATFFATSVGLTILANLDSGSSILDRLPGQEDGGIQPLAPQPLSPQPLVPEPPASSSTSGPQIPSAN